MAQQGRMAYKEAYCNGCHRVHLTTDFYKSKNPFHDDGVLLYCKTACGDIFDHYLTQTKNIESALWLTCSYLGVPFIKEAYDNIEAKAKERDDMGIKKQYNYIGNYMTVLGLIGDNNKKNYRDFSDTDVAYGEVNSVRLAEEAVKQDYERFEETWGPQEVEDYSFLENLFNKYTEDIEIDSRQEDLYRDLCLSRLRKRKLESCPNVDETDMTRVQNQIFSIMSKLKLDDFESQHKNPVDLMIFERIKMVEETMPCEDPDKSKYKDVDKIGKYLKSLIFRPMLNTLTGSRDFNVRDVKDLDIGGDD